MTTSHYKSGTRCACGTWTWSCDASRRLTWRWGSSNATSSASPCRTTTRCSTVAPLPVLLSNAYNILNIFVAAWLLRSYMHSLMRKRRHNRSEHSVAPLHGHRAREGQILSGSARARHSQDGQRRGFASLNSTVHKCNQLKSKHFCSIQQMSKRRICMHICAARRRAVQLPVSGGRRRRHCAAREPRGVLRVEAQTEREVREDRVSPTSSVQIRADGWRWRSYYIMLLCNVLAVRRSSWRAA